MQPETDGKDVVQWIQLAQVVPGSLELTEKLLHNLRVDPALELRHKVKAAEAVHGHPGVILVKSVEAAVCVGGSSHRMGISKLYPWSSDSTFKPHSLGVQEAPCATGTSMYYSFHLPPN